MLITDFARLTKKSLLIFEQAPFHFRLARLPFFNPIYLLLGRKKFPLITHFNILIFGNSKNVLTFAA
jgi:hypothetical protein